MYLEIGLDETGGTTFTTTGTSQFLSVPYALYSKNSANDADNQNLSIAGNQLSISGGNTVTVQSGPSAGNGISAFIPQRTIFTGQANSSCMTSTVEGSFLFHAGEATIGLVEKFTIDSLTGMYYQTAQDNYNAGTRTAQSMAVLGNNLFVYFGGSGGIEIKRYSVSDLSNNSMTIVGATIGNSPLQLFSDGTFLYVYNANGAFIKFSVNGSQLINQGTTVFNGMDINNWVATICDGSKVYFLLDFGDIERYDISGGNMESLIAYRDNSNQLLNYADDIGLAIIDNLRLYVGVSYVPAGTGSTGRVLLLNPVRKP